MAGALQGIGTPIGYPMQQLPWGQPWGGAGLSNLPGQQSFGQQLGQSGVLGPFGGTHLPQQLQSLQTAVQQLLQTQYIQQQHIQQLLQIVPQQLQQIHHLIQFVLQQPYQAQQLYGQQPFGGFPSQGLQPQLFGGQVGFGPQTGYVPPTGYVM